MELISKKHIYEVEILLINIVELYLLGARLRLSERSKYSMNLLQFNRSEYIYRYTSSISCGNFNRIRFCSAP